MVVSGFIRQQPGNLIVEVELVEGGFSDQQPGPAQITGTVALSGGVQILDDLVRLHDEIPDPAHHPPAAGRESIGLRGVHGFLGIGQLGVEIEPGVHPVVAHKAVDSSAETVVKSSRGSYLLT